MSREATPLLQVKDLAVEYRSSGWRRPANRVLHNVSLDIHEGETLGLVGESGSGKTTLGRSILGLVPVASGQIIYDGRDITRARRRARRALAREIQVVFQDPYSSLNPSLLVSDILSEPLRAAGIGGAESRRRVRELLDRVGMPADASERYPVEFSGGQRQRIAIARALALEPRLIICDEPVSALDLSTQARVLDLLIDIQERTGVTLLVISHDLSVIRAVCHRVAVMFKGEIVEQGSTSSVINHPTQMYTKKLLLAAPVTDPDEQRERREARRLLAETEAVA
ncbi:MAG: ABC transporter ATP-binding protein [Cryobacterium sp.]|nr:ABC transporter ATP-binding protein [Cryobacterium sp.]